MLVKKFTPPPPAVVEALAAAALPFYGGDNVGGCSLSVILTFYTPVLKKTAVLWHCAVYPSIRKQSSRYFHDISQNI